MNESGKVSLFSIFLTFFKISALTPGGGYAMLTVIENEVVKKNWITREHFIKLFTTSISLPGPLAMSTAILIGNHLRKLPGALAGFFGVIIPPLVAVIGVSIVFDQISLLPVVADFVKGAYYAVPGLVAGILYKTIRATRWKLISYLFSGAAAVLLIFFPAFTIPIFAGSLILFYIFWRPSWNSSK